MAVGETVGGSGRLELGGLLSVSALRARLEQRFHRLLAHVGAPDEPFVSLKTVGMSRGKIEGRSLEFPGFVDT